MSYKEKSNTYLNFKSKSFHIVSGNELSEKLLCLLATFDEETSKIIKEIYCNINEAGIIDKQTPDLPYHITLANFDTSHEAEVKQMLQEVCFRTTALICLLIILDYLE